MKWILILLILPLCCLAAELLINTYDMTAYLFLDGQRIQFKALCPSNMRLTDEFVDVYEPVRLTVGYIPLPNVPLLVSRKGLTMGTKTADIVVPEEVFALLFNSVKSGRTISLTVDRYPIEIYPNRIKVLEPVERRKIEFFLSHFLEKVPPVAGPGEYSLKEEISYQLIVSYFPGLGGAVMAIFESEPVQLAFVHNGVQTKGLCLALPPGTHSVEIVSSGSTTELNLDFPDQTVRFEPARIELGSRNEKPLKFLSGLLSTDSFSYPGRYVALEHLSNELIVHDLTVRDTTPPELVMNTKLIDSMCYIQLQAEDVSSYETFLYLDGERLPVERSGVLRLESARHTLIGVARDTFGNATYRVLVLESMQDFLMFTEEKTISVGGFKFFSPYLKWRIFDSASYEVKVNEKTFRIEKSR